jgi:hypothetical protein
VRRRDFFFSLGGGTGIAGGSRFRGRLVGRLKGGEEDEDSDKDGDTPPNNCC